MGLDSESILGLIQYEGHVLSFSSYSPVDHRPRSAHRVSPHSSHKPQTLAGPSESPTASSFQQW